MSKLPDPNENDSIDCHLQKIGMGSLICSGARQTGENTTNEVDPAICFNCPTGKIYRTIGCDAVLPKIYVVPTGDDLSVNYESLFCKIKKRATSFEQCQTCGLVTAETTRQVVSSTRGLFEAQGFYSAFKDVEKARESIRDGNFENAITRSIACLESTMHICHEKLSQPLPNSKQISDLWKSTRVTLRFDDIDPDKKSLHLLNSLSGTVTHLGGLRNSLSDAHGKGLYPPNVSESIAELAINTASTLATIIIRRFNQIAEENK